MIEIKKCSKSFGSVKAVDKVSLEIGEREVFGLVGSNGGKKYSSSYGGRDFEAG